MVIKQKRNTQKCGTFSKERNAESIIIITIMKMIMITKRPWIKQKMKKTLCNKEGTQLN